MSRNLVRQPVAADSAQPPSAAPVTIELQQLMKGGQELRLRHRDMEYRLRITRNDKLILTK